MIQSLQCCLSEKTSAEVAAIDKGRKDLFALVDDADSVSEYYSSHTSQTHWLEFVKKVDSKGLGKILDIGFGRGQTSLYLAHMGHEVHALEPSPLHCEILEKACEKYQLPIAIYIGGGEDIEQIPSEDFDLCIFNSSLHHCDDPMKALKACLKKLKPGGKVLYRERFKNRE